MEENVIKLIPGEWYLAKNKKGTFVILITKDAQKCFIPYFRNTRKTEELEIERQISKEEAKKIIENEIKNLKFAEGFSADTEDQMVKGFLVANTMDFIKKNF
ncbi:MAG TPA: hypothetical protein PK142_02455 [bacterium]|nr:hypothetical protein [bacterium]